MHGRKLAASTHEGRGQHRRAQGAAAELGAAEEDGLLSRRWPTVRRALHAARSRAARQTTSGEPATEVQGFSVSHDGRCNAGV